MSYKINTSASKLGFRDGKDAYLLDRKINNTFDPLDEIIAFEEYEEAWYRGFEEEQFK